MRFKILSDSEVKKTINKNKIFFREFYIEKTVYGYEHLGEILGMVAVSENKQLLGAKKIYHPFVKENEKHLAVKLIQDVVSAIENEGECSVIYTDCLDDAVPLFSRAGFRTTHQKDGLKRYNTLWRMVYDGNLLDK